MVYSSGYGAGVTVMVLESDGYGVTLLFDGVLVRRSSLVVSPLPV
jgi:hypothetical protein